jgi:hypothetical protein
LCRFYCLEPYTYHFEKSSHLYLGS